MMNRIYAALAVLMLLAATVGYSPVTPAVFEDKTPAVVQIPPPPPPCPPICPKKPPAAREG